MVSLHGCFKKSVSVNNCAASCISRFSIVLVGAIMSWRSSFPVLFLFCLLCDPAIALPVLSELPSKVCNYSSALAVLGGKKITFARYAVCLHRHTYFLAPLLVLVCE